MLFDSGTHLFEGEHHGSQDDAITCNKYFISNTFCELFPGITIAFEITFPNKTISTEGTAL